MRYERMLIWVLSASYSTLKFRYNITIKGKRLLHVDEAAAAI